MIRAVLMGVMVMVCAGNLWADGEWSGTYTGEKAYKSAATYTLTGDTTFSDTLSIENNDGTIVIDLNGHNLTIKTLKIGYYDLITHLDGAVQFVDNSVAGGGTVTIGTIDASAWNQTKSLDIQSPVTVTVTTSLNANTKGNGGSDAYLQVTGTGTLTVNGTISGGTYLNTSDIAAKGTLNGTAIVSSFTWTGTTSTAWSTASNWNENSVPGDNVAVIIPVVSSGNYPDSSSSLSLKNLSIADGASLTVSSGTLTVSGTSELAGTITTSSGVQTYTGNVTLSADCTINSGTSNTVFSGTVSGSSGSEKLSITASEACFTGNVGTIGDLAITGSLTSVWSAVGVPSFTCGALTVSGNALFRGPVTASSVEITGDVSFLDGTSFTTTGTQEFGGAVLIEKDISLAGTTVTFDGKIDTHSNGTNQILTVTGNSVFKGKIGSSKTAGISIKNGSAEFNEENNLYSLTVDNSGMTGASSVLFTAGKLQKIGSISAKGNSSGDLTLGAVSGETGSYWLVNFSTKPAASSFEYTKISYSKSVTSDGSTSDELEIVPAENKIQDAVPTEPSAISWFVHKYYWLGTSDTKWSTAANWAYDEAGTLAAPVPSCADGLSEIVLKKSGSNDIEFADETASLPDSLSLKSLLIESGNRLGLGAHTVSVTSTEAGGITNNGTVAIYGTQSSPVLSAATGGTVVHADDSYIEYYGSGTASDVLYISESDNVKTYKNLLIKQTGGSITFSSGVNASSFADVSTVTGTFKKSVTAGSSTLTLNGTWTFGDSSSPDTEVTITNSVSNAKSITCVGNGVIFAGDYSGSGAFTASSGTTTFGGKVDFSAGTFINSSGTVILENSGSYSLKCRYDDTEKTTFNNIQFGKTASNTKYCTVSGKLTVSGNMTVNNVVISESDLYINGDLTANVICTFTGTVKFAGSSAQNYTNSSSGTVNLGTIECAGAGGLNLNSNLTVKNVKIDSGCTLTCAGTPELTVSGNFDNGNGGTFSAGSSTVNLTGSSESVFTGDTTFYALKCTTAGKTVKFTAGSTTTVSNAFTVTGSLGSEISLLSSTENSEWKIDCSGAAVSVSYVKLQDSDNVSLDSGNIRILSAANSIDSGNNTNWNFPGVIYTWTGSTDSVWHKKTNWNPASIPGTSATVSVPDVSSVSNKFPEFDSAVEIAKITIDADANINLNGKNFTVNGTDAGSFTNNGTVKTLGSEKVSFQTGAVSENGTWEYNGGTVQTINNLTFININIAAPVNISGTVTAAEFKISAAGTSGTAVVTCSAETELDAPVVLASEPAGYSFANGGYSLNLKKAVSGTDYSFKLSGTGTTTLSADVSVKEIFSDSSLKTGSITISSTGNQTYNGTVSGSDATAAVVFGDTAADDRTVTFKNDISGFKSLTSNYPVDFNAEDRSFSAEASDGITLNQSSKVTGTNTVTFSSNVTGTSIITGTAVVLNCSSVTADSVTFADNVSGTGATINAETYFSGDSTVSAAAFSVSKNLIIYGGNISIAADISVSEDLIILGKDYSEDDSASGVPGLFSYNNAKRDTAAVSFTGTVPSTHTATLSVTGGKTITVGKNFYGNGTSITGTGTWTLKIPDNDSAAAAFAELYNSSISNVTVTGITTADGAWLSAGENCTDGSGNTRVDFGHPLIKEAYTVYDDVIFVSFVDSDGTTVKTIENTNNEISAAVKKISNSKGVYAAAFTDADCNVSTDGKGDLSEFYIRSGEKWNTDASGISAGDSESTDRSGTNHGSGTSGTIPYLNIPKALSDVYATLRDCHKTRIAHYYSASPSLPSSIDSANSSTGAAYTKVIDKCSPVLVSVRTGQELHTADASSQTYYDSHNFIEWQYSEAVNISDGSGIQMTLANKGDSSKNLNQKVNSNLGQITNGTGITVAGLSSFAAGKAVCGKDNVSDDTVHALYRNFEVIAGTTEYQSHRIRLGIASYADGTVTVSGTSYKNWNGYIDEAETPSGTVTRLSNSLITDAAGNVLSAGISGETKHALPVLTVNRTAENLYGLWDVSKPVFASFNSVSSMSVSGDYEILGSTDGISLVLTKVEFHMFDNASNNPVWYTQVGWGTSPTSLYKSFSYAADIFGGSRPFADNSSLRTSGGIRYSTIYGKSSYFTYGTGSTPDTAFKDATITGGAVSQMFFPTSGSKNSTGTSDSLYYAVYLPDGSSLPLKTTFSISYNKNGCVTDLAGNRLDSASVSSVDRVTPGFSISAAKVYGNKLYLVFNKAMNTGSMNLIKNDGTTVKTGTIADSLRFVEIDSTGQNFTVSSSLQIDKTVSTAVTYLNDRYTGLVFTLNRNVTLEDIRKLSIQCYCDEENGYEDPLTGVTGTSATFVQDTALNFMSHLEAHALSDFAINAVNPVYAYDNRQTDSGTVFTESMYDNSSYAVHDWSRSQQNFGSLMTGHDITIVSTLEDGDSENDLNPAQCILYMDNNPDSGSVSENYNSHLNAFWRMWLPSEAYNGGSAAVTVDAFASLADKVNTGVTAVPFTVDSALSQHKFVIPYDVMNSAGFVSGNQISFLFGLADSDGAPEKICHAPVLDEATGKYTMDFQPLFAARLEDSSDITSVDLWSFRLKDIVLQRGNVTILNNVINASRGEITTVNVNMPSEGNLNVIVMTLDGNIVQYLQHGNASAGSHNFTWNGITKSGKKVARGLYFVRVFGNGIDETRKVMVVKD